MDLLLQFRSSYGLLLEICALCFNSHGLLKGLYQTQFLLWQQVSIPHVGIASQGCSSDDRDYLSHL